MSIRTNTIKTVVTEILDSNDLAAEFVFDAVQRYSNSVSDSDPDTYTNPLRGGRNWYQTAKQIKSKIDRRFS